MEARKFIIKSAVTLPKNKKVIENYKRECSEFKIGNDVQQYDDVPGDPHTLQPLLELTKFSEEIGLSPEEVSTNFEHVRPYCFYALATGSESSLLNTSKDSIQLSS